MGRMTKEVQEGLCCSKHENSSILAVELTGVQVVWNSHGQTTVFVLYFSQASGGRDKIIHIWDPDSLQHVHTFKGHKDAVSVSLTYYCLKHCPFYKTWLWIKLFHVSSLFFFHRV